MMCARVALLFLIIAIIGAHTATARNVAGRIVGGETALPGQFPYQVSLRRWASGNHFCGGSIIRSNWILSVSHCLVDTDPSTIFIVAGAHTLSAGGTVYNVSEIVRHELFNATYKQNDIALLQTTIEMQFNRLVRPIVIGDENYVPAGVAAQTSGWGRLYFQGPLPDKLQYLHMTTVSNEDCRARHTEEFVPYITESMLCVYANQPERGVCNGDSGGPLISNGVLIGAVCTADPCARGKPDIFTRLSTFVPWVLAHIDGAETSTTAF